MKLFVSSSTLFYVLTSSASIRPPGRFLARHDACTGSLRMAEGQPEGSIGTRRRVVHGPAKSMRLRREQKRIRIQLSPARAAHPDDPRLERDSLHVADRLGARVVVEGDRLRVRRFDVNMGQIESIRRIVGYLELFAGERLDRLIGIAGIDR